MKIAVRLCFIFITTGLLFGCAMAQVEWDQARYAGTLEAFETFFQKYPDSVQAKQNRGWLVRKRWDAVKAKDTEEAYARFFDQNAAFFDENPGSKKEYEKGYEVFLEWRSAEQSGSVTDYENFIIKNRNSDKNWLAKERLKAKYNMDKSEVEAVEKMQKKKNPDVELPDTLSRLIMTGANSLNNGGNWINIIEGRRIYDILKKANATKVIDSMRRVIVVSINRPHVLMLAVKLGINGTEAALNSLLLDYGDKSMAEDYLNSGSSILHEGGVAWANRHGYNISTGPGSSRASWGAF